MILVSEAGSIFMSGLDEATTWPLTASSVIQALAATDGTGTAESSPTCTGSVAEDALAEADAAAGAAAGVVAGVVAAAGTEAVVPEDFDFGCANAGAVDNAHSNTTDRDATTAARAGDRPLRDCAHNPPTLAKNRLKATVMK